MKKIAIITGASGGIGQIFVRELMKEELYEIWVIGRNQGRLLVLKEEFGEKESLIIMSEKYLGNYLNAQEVIEYCDMTLNLRRKK